MRHALLSVEARVRLNLGCSLLLLRHCQSDHDWTDHDWTPDNIVLLAGCSEVTRVRSVFALLECQSRPSRPPQIPSALQSQNATADVACVPVTCKCGVQRGHGG